jgi:hypothetical protein
VRFNHKQRVILMTGLLMASCATVAPKAELPPAAWLEDCPIPQLEGDTNGALASFAARLRDALIGCNVDKASLRGWLEESQ